MKFSNPAKWSLASAAVLGAVACASTLSLEGDCNLAGAGGSFKLKYDGREVDTEDLPGDGNRADVEFYDKNGNKIPNSGATGVSEGEKVPVPRGATHVTYSGPSGAPSCTGCTGSGGGSGGGMAELLDELANTLALDPSQRIESQWNPPSGGGGLPLRGTIRLAEKWAYVYTLDGDFDGSTAWSNVSASFTINGSLSASQIGARISLILTEGAGAVVPSDVTVESYVRMDAEKLGARLFVADKTQSFTSFAMTWNDYPKTPTFYDAPNGWNVAEVFIPIDEISVAVPGIGANNRIDLTWMTYEDTVLNEIHESRYFAVE